MNSRERVIAALEGRIPDHVPVMEMFIDEKVIHSICPGMTYEDFIDFADMDAVTCLTMADKPDDIKWVDKKKRIWRDKWGAMQRITEDVISVVIPPAKISTEADIEAYQLPEPSKAVVLETARKLVKRFKGKKAIAVVGEAGFAPSQYMRAGLENLMIDFIERPELVRKLAKIGIDYHVELYRRLLAEGVEIVILGDDYAGKSGPFMSPAHFNRFILPELTTIIKAVKQAGGYVVKHCDGNIWPLMDMLISTGVDMLGPLEPAYMKLDEVRRYSKNRVGVLGNVDVDLLSQGTKEEVETITKELLRRVSPMGGHILSSGNTISSSVRGENFIAMLQVVKEFGKYPISIRN